MELLQLRIQEAYLTNRHSSNLISSANRLNRLNNPLNNQTFLEIRQLSQLFKNQPQPHKIIYSELKLKILYIASHSRLLYHLCLVHLQPQHKIHFLVELNNHRVKHPFLVNKRNKPPFLVNKHNKHQVSLGRQALPNSVHNNPLLNNKHFQDVSECRFNLSKK